MIRAFYIIIYTLHIGIIGMFYQCYVIVLHVLDDFMGLSYKVPIFGI